jgi:CubicO group peptidase (beta-lactamase class C family)
VREFAFPDLSGLRRAVANAVVGVSRSAEQQVVPVGSAEEHSVFRIASLTKVFTAVTTVRALASAGVPLTAPALSLLPELADRWRACGDITVAQLLAQTSGLRPGVSGATAAAVGDGDDALLAAGALVGEQGSDRAPGERWEYYNGNYFLAGAIAARLRGGTYEDALEELVLRPAGLQHTTFFPPAELIPGMAEGETIPESGYARARRPSGGLVSSVPDLLTFLEHLLDARDGARGPDRDR